MFFSLQILYLVSATSISILTFCWKRKLYLLTNNWIEMVTNKTRNKNVMRTHCAICKYNLSQCMHLHPHVHLIIPKCQCYVCTMSQDHPSCTIPVISLIMMRNGLVLEDDLVKKLNIKYKNLWAAVNVDFPLQLRPICLWHVL